MKNMERLEHRHFWNSKHPVPMKQSEPRKHNLGTGINPLPDAERQSLCSYVPIIIFKYKDKEYKGIYTIYKKFIYIRARMVSWNCHMEGELMKESTIESKLRRAVKSMGGMCIKLIASSMDGLPDRMVLLPGRRIAFVELKAPGKKMRPLQVKRKRQLELLGFSVYCIDNPEQIGGMLDEIRTS